MCTSKIFSPLCVSVQQLVSKAERVDHEKRSQSETRKMNLTFSNLKNALISRISTHAIGVIGSPWLWHLLQDTC